MTGFYSYYLIFGHGENHLFIYMYVAHVLLLVYSKVDSKQETMLSCVFLNPWLEQGSLQAPIFKRELYVFRHRRSIPVAIICFMVFPFGFRLFLPVCVTSKKSYLESVNACIRGRVWMYVHAYCIVVVSFLLYPTAATGMAGSHGARFSKLRKKFNR